MTTNISDFVDNVRADVPLCPDPVIEDAIRDAITDFCKQTWIIQRDFTFNTVEIDVMDELNNEPLIEFDGVAPTIPDVGMRPVVVIRVFVSRDGYPNDYVALRILDKTSKPFQYWEAQTTDGLPTHYFPVNNSTIRVYPVPTENYYLTIRAAFKPKRDSSEFDSLLYDDWLEEICAGAKFRLFGRPNKPWTDYTIAVFEKQLYQTGIGKARMLVSNDFTDRIKDVTTRSFVNFF